MPHSDGVIVTFPTSYEVLGQTAKVAKYALHRNLRLGHVDEFAAAAAYVLDPKMRPGNGHSDGEKYITDYGLPYLMFKRFGDTSDWEVCF